MKQFQGSCHCGAVSFSFPAETIDKGLRCTCSMCVRKGAMMSAFVVAADELKANLKSDALGCYQFGTNVAKHYFCKNCGIYTFNETLRMPGKFRVNLGCVDGVDPMALEADVFDGKNLI